MRQDQTVKGVIFEIIILFQFGFIFMFKANLFEGQHNSDILT